jgi:hypothetical protein
MQYSDLLLLAKTLAAHKERTLNTVARWSGVHLTFFERLEAGAGCRVDTYRKVFDWFDENWPDDLAWPADVQRPSAVKRRRVA